MFVGDFILTFYFPPQFPLGDKYGRVLSSQTPYMITINHQLSIYTSMNHSLLFLKLSRAHAQLFRHPVQH